MITPSPTRATMLSSVWETRVPSRTGKVSRTRPMRRARTMARAGSPTRARRAAVGAHEADVAADPLAGTGRLGHLDRALVDVADLVGDPRPGVALGADSCRPAHLGQALGFVVGALQLLGEALGVGRRDEDPVD